MNSEDDYSDLPEPWSPECYKVYDICCDLESVKEEFEKIEKQFPAMLWGTHIYHKSYNKEETHCYLVVRRFVSIRETIRHCTLPTLGWDLKK